MWSFNKDNMAVTMHKGDTGSHYVRLHRKSGEPFEEGDVAIYEVYRGSTLMMHREYDLQPETPDGIELGDGRFLVAFRNSDTDTWTAGTYQVEIRVVLNSLRANGNVADGDTVRTIVRSTITIQDVLINI